MQGHVDAAERQKTAGLVEEWLRRFKANAVPDVPKNAKTPAWHSTGSSVTTIKCALDAFHPSCDA